MDTIASSYILMLIALLSNVHSHCPQEISFNDKNFSRGVRLQQSYVFAYFHSFSLRQCMKECILRRKCQIITFSTTDLTCEIGHFDTATEEVSDQSFLTSGLQWIPQEELAGACAYHNCSNLEKCIELRSKQVKCILSECRYPLYTSNTLEACYFITNYKMNYTEAQQVCNNIGGRLPRIDSFEKYENFLSIPDGFYWIDGIVYRNEIVPYYSDNTPYIFSMFANNGTCSEAWCGVCLGTQTNEMYFRNSFKDYKVVCQMYP